MTKGEKVRLSSKGQLVLPKDIREAIGVKEGDELVVILDGESVVLTRLDALARLSRGMLKGTWGRTRREIDRALDQERESWE